METLTVWVGVIPCEGEAVEERDRPVDGYGVQAEE